MANRVERQTLIDTNKRTLLKYVIFADGTATANSSLIKFNELRFAKNANSYISNTDPKPHYGVGIKRVYGYSKIQNAAGYITLKWEDAANSEILAFGSNDIDIDVSGGLSGDAATIYSAAANVKGLIYSATSPTAGDVVNLFIDIRKDSKDFDAGAGADPQAFNAGNRSLV
jgi:hypothetical protein